MRNRISAVCILAFIMIGLFSPSTIRAGTLQPVVEPGAMQRLNHGKLEQIVYINLPESFPARFVVRTAHPDGGTETSFDFARAPERVAVFVPACREGTYPLRVKILDGNARLLYSGRITIRLARQWKIYLLPFTHVDIGFTQSQRKVLIQNLKNLDIEMDLIEKTRNYPADARFRLFTEVSWAISEYLRSPDISAARKQRLLRAITENSIEPGAFYISHQNKFMPPEAIIASLLPAMEIGRRTGRRITTACIHDVFDFSGVLKPLRQAGVKYLMVGPNDARYAVPPLFYLMPPAGSDRLLVWHTTGLNGYGENFDLGMKLSPQMAEAEFTQMEHRISRHLKGLEEGYPTKDLQKYYTYYGARWDYPYDAFLLPYYPARGGDNQPQNSAPSDIAKEWNRKWKSPRMIVATPREFFGYVESRFRGSIPVIRGEMSGFWGEQIYLDMAQVDPRKQACQVEFERNCINSGIALSENFLKGKESFNPAPFLWKGYKPLILINDHNPRPVPFGKTNYDDRDVDEWMFTRGSWINIMAATGRWMAVNSGADTPDLNASDSKLLQPARAYRKNGEYILENRYYRAIIDPRSGGIKSLMDLELNKELVDPGARYKLNQYVAAVRGENAAERGYLLDGPGFSSVDINIDESVQGSPRIIISGYCESQVQGSVILSRFVREAFGVKIPPFILRLVNNLFAYVYGPLKLVQEISLSPGEKRIDFVQRFSGRMPQMTEHLFAYPVAAGSGRGLAYDSAYNLLEFTPGPPLGNGDIIPAAKNIAPYPSINDSLHPFRWMYGMPPDFTFNTYVMSMGDGYAVAFSSRESRVIIPGPLKHDPENGPFNKGFYQCAIGWTLWGMLGLGAVADRETVFRNSITSFSASRPGEAREKAFIFGWRRNGYAMPSGVSISPSSVRTVSIRPDGGKALILRLWETSGRKSDARVIFTSGKKVTAAFPARPDGTAISGIPARSDGFSFSFGPGELRTFRVEF